MKQAVKHLQIKDKLHWIDAELMKKIEWTISDVLDLEYLLKQNASVEDDQEIHKRDRERFINEISPELHLDTTGDVNVFRKEMIKLWLDKQKHEETNKTGSQTFFPGIFFDETIHLLNRWFLLAGLLTGISVCLSFFSYTGTQPINVSYFIGVTVFLQIILLLFFTGSFLLSTRGSIFSRSWVPYPLLSLFVKKLILKFNKKLITKIPVEKREKIISVFGLMHSGNKVYGLLFFWPLCILVQLFGVGFNIGILGSTLFRILFFDTAFGWQSTVQFSAGMINKIVSIIALPWSWFVPEGLACPTLEQIEGSRMVLKSGIYHLATEDLVSWWPFLCLAVLFYGLLPRLFLLFSGYWAVGKNLAGLTFDHGECEKLVRRLLTPLVSIKSYGSEKRKEENHQNAINSCDETVNQREHLALVPDDIYDACDPDELKRVAESSLGCYLNQHLRIGIDMDMDLKKVEKSLSTAQAADLPNHLPGVLILQEAWQPPISEMLYFIKQLRKSGGEKMPLIVGLIGKPGPDTIFTKPDPANVKIWNVKMSGIGDPYLRIESLVI